MRVCATPHFFTVAASQHLGQFFISDEIFDAFFLPHDSKNHQGDVSVYVDNESNTFILFIPFGILDSNETSFLFYLNHQYSPSFCDAAGYFNEKHQTTMFHFLFAALMLLSLSYLQLLFFFKSHNHPYCLDATSSLSSSALLASHLLLSGYVL